MSVRRDVQSGADPAPHDSLRAQAGGSGLRTGGWRIAMAVLGPPTVWSLHFLGVYLLVAWWCSARWDGLGVVISVFSILCLGGAIALGALAFRLWRQGQAALLSDAEPGGPGPWDARMGERGARMSFLAVLALLMAALFSLLILLESLPPLFTAACHLAHGS